MASKYATMIDKKEEIKSLVKESEEMVGEKHLQEGIFHKIFRGYLPLNLLSALNLEPKDKDKITAYCHLVGMALRRSKESHKYLLKGYGTTLDAVSDRLTAYDELSEDTKKLDTVEKEVSLTLDNPYPELKEWFRVLGISRQDLDAPILNPFQIDQDAYIQPVVLERMSKIGLFRLKVPAKYGGLGFSQKEYDAVLRTLAHISGTLLAVVSAHSTIGSAPLMLYGSEEQKEYYLKDVSNGNYLCAFGLTEPTSGTDAVGKMKSTAKLSSDGKHWIINGEKIYITNIHRAGIMYLMARTDHGDGTPVAKMRPTVFIVDLPFNIHDSMEEIRRKIDELAKQGMKMSMPLDLIDIRGSNQAHIIFKDFKVPVNKILGGVDDGSKVIFNGLNRGRAAFGASSAEAGRFIFETALYRATTREMFKVFGGKQSDLPQVKRYISKLAILASSLRAISNMTSAYIEERGDSMNIIAECAAIKILATEGSWEAANYGLRIWGGTGTMKGHPGMMELAFRDAWIGIVVEGVNEAMKQLVSGVGVQGAKDDFENIVKHYLTIFMPFKKVDPAKKKKRKFKFDLIGAFIPAHFRLIGGLLKFESGNLSFGDALWLQIHTKILAFKTAVLGMVYGNKMVVKQLELIRMADVAMDLYSIAAVQLSLKKHLNIEDSEKLALRLFVKLAKKRVWENLRALKLNNKDDREDMKVADLWIKNYNK